MNRITSFIQQLHHGSCLKKHIALIMIGMNISMAWAMNQMQKNSPAYIPSLKTIALETILKNPRTSNIDGIDEALPEGICDIIRTHCMIGLTLYEDLAPNNGGKTLTYSDGTPLHRDHFQERKHGETQSDDIWEYHYRGACKAIVITKRLHKLLTPADNYLRLFISKCMVVRTPDGGYLVFDDEGTLELFNADFTCIAKLRGCAEDTGIIWVHKTDHKVVMYPWGLRDYPVKLWDYSAEKYIATDMPMSQFLLLVAVNNAKKNGTRIVLTAAEKKIVAQIAQDYPKIADVILSYTPVDTHDPDTDISLYQYSY